MTEKPIESIRETLEIMRKTMAQVEELGKNLVHVMQSDAFLSKDESNEIKNALATLERQSENCQNLYATLKVGPLPQFLYEVEDKLDSEQAKLQKLELVQVSFLALKGTTPEAQAALNIYQNNLNNLLQKKDSINPEDLKPYADFLNALQHISDPVQKMNAAMQLTQYFGNELIGYAFMGQSIIIPDGTAINAGDTTAKVENKKSIPAKPVPVAIDKAKTVEDIEEKQIEHVKEPEELSEAAKSWLDFCKKHEIRLPADYQYEKPNVIDYSKKSKKVSVSRFISDLEENYYLHDMACKILYYIVRYNFCINKKFISFAFPQDGQKVSQSALEMLIRRGYIRHCSIKNVDEFYEPTGVFIKLLSSNKVIRKLHLEKVNYSLDIEYGADIETVSYALLRLASIDMTCLFCSAYINADSIADGLSTSDCGFYQIFNISNNNSNKQYFCFGFFSSVSEDSPEVNGELLNALKENALKDQQCTIIIGMMREQIQAIYGALAEEPDYKLLLDRDVFFYVLPEQQLYTKDWQPVKDKEFTQYLEGSPRLEAPEKEIQNSSVKDTITANEKIADSATKDKKNTQDELKPSDSKKVSSKPSTKTLKSQNVKKADKSDSSIVIPQEKEEPNPVQMNEEEKNRILAKAFQFTLKNRLDCAATWLQYISLNYQDMQLFYQRYAYAVSDPAIKLEYSSDRVYSLFATSDSVFEEYLLIASAIRTFFSNQTPYDYSMHSLSDLTKGKSLVEQCPELGDLLYHLSDFKQKVNKGIDFYADYRRKDQKKQKQRQEKLHQEALAMYDNLINKKITESASFKRLVETKKILFAKNGDIASCLEIVCNNDIELISLVEEYLNNNFIQDGKEIDEENIDLRGRGKLENLMDSAWDKAAEKLTHAEHNKKLMSSRRSNLKNQLERLAILLCRWVRLVRTDITSQDDSNLSKYSKVKATVLKDIGKYFARTVNNTEEDRAGYYVLVYCLGEIQDRLTGAYNLWQHKYFYVNFLRSNHILLNENYIPDFHNWFMDNSQEILYQDLTMYAQEELPDLQKRIADIFVNGEDDYLIAVMCDQYLQDSQGYSYIQKQEYKIEDFIKYADNDSAHQKEEFEADLELAQSYGQIDNSERNQKEDILAVIDDCFTYSQQTHNYGVFRYVRDYYKQKIKKDAQVRGKELQDQAKNYAASFKYADADQQKLIKARMELIKQMIDEQNYTVAEDLLNHSPQESLTEGTILFTKDYLKDFLNHYPEYYRQVNHSGDTLANLLGKNKVYNKKGKGGAGIIKNWIAQDRRTDGDIRMMNLLNLLGWNNIDYVKPLAVTENKVHSYEVCLKSLKNGRKSNYQHPIAAFGSLAQEKGFRAATIFGKYDADSLMERFRQLGDSMHTIVFLDYALSLTERRRLARKIKNAALNKVFAVVDRVAIDYIIRNYDETQVNRILMQIIMPFSYYQPYVWESANVMPPELFMGRNEELKKIEDPNGVNIVYGGRQLGKSALLKMARTDLDHNENGDRAVIVDIKGRNYQEAALKVSQALSDSKFFHKEIITDDWDQLSREIKKRLLTQVDHIGYFLLMMDEADAFIESCGTINYRPLDALKDIQSIGQGRFKFVIAGLRNIVRFNHQKALSNNSVLTHLSSMTVRPFKPTEARELLEIPLYYLGFRFSREKEALSLVPLILASTNYFPGLIQFYCAKLIEAMTHKDYAGYEQSDTPIYMVTTQHIKSVLADPKFREQIKEKFEITLELGNDRYYYILALLMAQLYHEKGYSKGYTPKEVLAEANAYGIPQFESFHVEQIQALMEELQELNVFRQNEDGHYLFARQAFFQMMGNKEEVDDKLIEVMG